MSFARFMMDLVALLGLFAALYAWALIGYALQS
jgi:hypothetical protein